MGREELFLLFRWKMETSFTDARRNGADHQARKNDRRRSKKICCFAPGITVKTLGKVILDVIFTLVDMAFDIILTRTFFRSIIRDLFHLIDIGCLWFRSYHYKWGTASILVIFLPGITCTVARVRSQGFHGFSTCISFQCISDNSGSNKESNRHWIRNFSWTGMAKILFTLFLYPFWLIYLWVKGGDSVYKCLWCRAYGVLFFRPDVTMMVHVKAWEGLMESSWQFLIQVFFSQMKSEQCQLFLPGCHFPV